MSSEEELDPHPPHRCCMCKDCAASFEDLTENRTMKTFIIFNAPDEGVIMYFVAEGDFDHLAGIYLGDNSNEELQEELNILLKDLKNRYTFPYDEFEKGDIVIECGRII